MYLKKALLFRQVGRAFGIATGAVGSREGGVGSREGGGGRGIRAKKQRAMADAATAAAVFAVEEKARLAQDIEGHRAEVHIQKKASLFFPRFFYFICFLSPFLFVILSFFVLDFFSPRLFS